MSTTQSPNLERAIERCRPADVEPVCIDAATLESTAPDYLRDLKRRLGERNLFPAGLSVEACFAADCSLATQDEADRLRGYVRAASFLGAGTVTVDVDEVGDEEKVRPALKACAERARREGVVLDVDGPVSIA